MGNQSNFYNLLHKDREKAFDTSHTCQGQNKYEEAVGYVSFPASYTTV